MFANASQPPSALPPGMRYGAHVISAAEEKAAAARIAALDLQPFAFQGFLGNRRTASFGWRYDFNGGGLKRAGEMPGFVLDLRARAASFAGIAPEELEQALAIEYAPGAGIGWHRDRPQFGKVVALSLLAPCKLRFRKRDGERWTRLAVTPAPRSAYLLDQEARDKWEHSIPPVGELRYSMTFRTFRDAGSARV